MSDSLWPHTLQYTRFLYPSLSPRVFSNTCPLSQWCHPTTSSSVTPFTSCSQSFSASGPFPMYWFFTLGGQSIGSSASASVLHMNIQCWFLLGLTGLIFLLSKGLLRVFSSTIVWKYQLFSAQPSLWANSHICTYYWKNHSFEYLDFVGKVMSLLFNMLSWFIIAFLPRSKHLLVSWLQSLLAVAWELKNIKSITDTIVSSSICHEVVGPDP